MKMKMLRNLIILGAVIVVLVVLIVVVLPGLNAASPSASPAASAADLQICSYTVDQVSEATIENGKSNFTLTKSGSNYVLKGQEAITLDQTAAGDIFSGVSGLSADEVIADSPTDLDQYGLKNPQATATAKYTDGTACVYLLGDELADGTDYYFMKQGDPKVYSISSSVGTAYLSTADSLRAKESFTITQATDIDYIESMKNGNVVVEMTSNNANSAVSISPWMIVQPWERSVDSDQLSTYEQAILGVTMGDIVEGDAKDLSKYGLDKPVYDIKVGGKDSNGKEVTNELLIGADKDSSNAYAKFADSGTVYLVDKSSLSFTGTTAYMLMDKTIVLVNIQSALAVSLQCPSVQNTMAIDQTPSKDSSGNVQKDSNGNTEYDQTFLMGGKQLDDKTARYFYEVVIGLQTRGMVDPGWKPTDTTPVATLTYTRSSDPKEIKIEFLPYDKDFYVISINGGPQLFLVQQSDLQVIADDMTKLAAGTLVVPANS